MAQRDAKLVLPGEEIVIGDTLRQLSGIPFTFVGNGATMIVAKPNLREVYNSGVVDIFKYDNKQDVADLKQLPLKMLRLRGRMEQQMSLDVRMFDRSKPAPGSTMPESQQVTQMKTELAAMQARYDELSSRPPLTRTEAPIALIIGGRKSRLSIKKKKKKRSSLKH